MCRTNPRGVTEAAGKHRQRHEDPRAQSRNWSEATAYKRPLSLGSRKSLRASPNRANASTSNVMASPG